MPFRTGKSAIYQYDIIVNGHRFRGSCRTTDLETAKAVEAKIRADGTTRTAQNRTCTLSEALGTYFRDVARLQPSAATTESQARGLLDLMDGATPLNRLTNADILNFVSQRRARVSNATVNRQLQLLGRALRHMRRNYSADIPDLDLRGAQTREPKERVRELSMDEQKRLFEHLRTDLHPLVQFALMTGARLSTITGLLWSDVNLDHGEMQFRLKGGESMTYPISADMRAFLGSLPRSNILSHRRHVITYIDRITGERKRIPASGGGLMKHWRDALERADILDFRFHDLRHTFATRMLRQSQNIKLVSRLLGHASIETTNRYAHVLIDDMARALETFSPISGLQSQDFPQNQGSTY